MRFVKWISMLTILAMLFAMLPATVAEDGIVIGMEEFVDDELEIDVEGGIEGPDAIDDPSIALEHDALDLDGLEDNLLIPGEGECTEVSPASNVSGDFEIDENGTLTRYGGFEKNVVIPDGVKEIGNEAFHNYTNLESVIIPDSVTYIGGFIYGAFQGCTGLKSIKLPNSITGLGSWVFEGCTSLTDVTLPNNLERCGIRVFANCTSLKSIVIPNSVKEIDNDMFSGCSSLVSIQLPDNMEELAGAMFNDCDSIKDLSFLTGIKKIGGSAFSNCDGLKSISIPGSVTSLGSYTFSNCSNLESVEIHENVTFIDRDAFSNSNNVVIRGTAGSYAESYANGVGIPFNAPVVSFDDSCYDYRDHWDDANKFAVIYINQSRSLDTTQRPVDLARDLAWSSSNPEVATVDKSGVVKGISQGEAIITAATADGKGRAAQIKVVVPEPTKLWFGDWWGDETKNLEIKLRDAREIYAHSEIPYKDETKVDMPLTLASSDDSIVTAQLSEDNKVTLKAVNLGKATITGTTPDGGKASVEVEVIRPDAESVKIDQSAPIKLYPGKKYSLSATLTPAEAEAKLTWYSDDTGNATVDQDGMVTAVSEGWGEIYVRTDNDHSDSIEVHVLRAPDTITLSKTKATLAAGDSLTLKATIVPMDAETALAWSSSKPAVAKVNKNGKITALKPGKAKITVRTDNGKKASCTITVKPAPTKVKLSRTRATLGVKEKLTLKATLSPSKAYTRLTWRSGDKTVASVTQKGVVTPKKPGTAVITVSTGNGKTARATITVKAAPKSVTLNKSGTVELAKGKQLKLKATLPKNTASALTWKSSKPKVASVDNNGVVTAKAKGTADITVNTYNGKTAKVTVTVK